MLDAIILAGGLGTRLRNVIGEMPKALAPINNTPFLDFLIQQLRQEGISRIIIAAGFGALSLQRRYGNSLIFSCEEMPLGTGGALKKAWEYVVGSSALILNGDSYFEISLKNMILQHQTNDADFTMACTQVADSKRFGTISFDPLTHRITSFSEKTLQNSQWINAGIYVMERALLPSFPQKNCFSLEYEVFPMLLQKKIFAYTALDAFIDIGTEGSYLAAQHHFKGVLDGN